MRLQDKKPFLGDVSQLLRVNRYRMEGGFADGTRCVDIQNETGLHVTVMPDRCMDIAYLRYKGINVSYISRGGIVAPQYYDPHGNGWQRTFSGGFLTTCGLDNIGSSCNDNGVEKGLHGRLSHTPAAEFCAKTIDDGECLKAVLSGKMNQNIMFGEKLTLFREIEVESTRSRLIIRDTVVNDAYWPQEYMLLYHFNLGYPFLSPECSVDIPSTHVEPRNRHAADYIHHVHEAQAPEIGEEMCYYHTLPDTDEVTVKAYNHQYHFGCRLTFERRFLTHFVQWKNLVPGEYVMGLEPATNYVNGIAYERQNDILQTLPPQSARTHQVIVEFFE